MIHIAKEIMAPVYLQGEIQKVLSEKIHFKIRNETRFFVFSFLRFFHPLLPIQILYIQLHLSLSYRVFILYVELLLGIVLMERYLI